MKKFYPLKKLAIGIVLFSTFYILNDILGGADGIAKIDKYFNNLLFGFMSKNLASVFSSLICLPIPIFMVYCFVSGLFRICTCNQYIPQFEDKSEGGIVIKGHNSYPNINRILRYRESKMSSMDNERAADLYISSSKLESLYTGYNNGPETQRTLSYIESKLSSMSSDRALNYLANKL